jgi:hypothetical protein
MGRIVGQTAKCIKCLKRPANFWCGYVRKGRNNLLAGWCNRCRREDGFYGHWRREMGNDDET